MGIFVEVLGYLVNGEIDIVESMRSILRKSNLRILMSYSEYISYNIDRVEMGKSGRKYQSPKSPFPCYLFPFYF